MGKRFWPSAALAFALFGAAAAAQAQTQDFPVRPVHVIVPFDYTEQMRSWLRLTIAATQTGTRDTRWRLRAAVVFLREAAIQWLVPDSLRASRPLRSNRPYRSTADMR